LLLEFLGGKKEEEEKKKVAGEVELIASVPLAVETAASMPPDVERSAAIPDGIAWTLSTFDLDRFGERIDPLGWDFSRFLQNPVVEWAHRYDIPAIGKIEGLAVDDEGLHGLVYFNDKSFDAFGWSIGQRVKAGVIRAGSVGFRVMEIEIPAAAESKDGTTLIFRNQELLEFSICNVPANPAALIKADALAKAIEAAKTETTQELNHPTFWAGLINNL
jgi:HK97 family phage prohead protease